MLLSTKLIPFYCLFLLISATSYSQKHFQSGILAGMNGSQINGDQMAGFDKGGFMGGIYVDFPFSEKWSGGFEMLFTMKGSRRSISTDSLGNVSRGPGLWDNLELGYVEVPFLARYHFSSRVEAYAGPSAALLLYSSYTPDRGGEAPANFLRNYDIGICGGISYTFLPHFSFTLRYTNSITTIGTGKANLITAPVNTGLLNIVASGAVYYHFFPKF
jgi:hypothetical protein